MFAWNIIFQKFLFDNSFAFLISVNKKVKGRKNRMESAFESNFDISSSEEEDLKQKEEKGTTLINKKKYYECYRQDRQWCGFSTHAAAAAYVAYQPG